MYWLVGISIIVVMIGTLTIATLNLVEDMALPLNSFVVSSTIWLLLILTTVILLLIIQRNALLPLSTNLTNSSLLKYKAQNITLPFKFIRYLLVIVLVGLLIIGSALQALSGYQQAESTKIDEPMRVQALVTIEGISDSVYNPEINSGYRQVATLQAVSPLVSELTSQDLHAQTRDYINNSLSNSNLHDKNLYDDTGVGLEYRVLLNAYSNKSSNNKQTSDLNNLQPGDQLLMTLNLMPLATSEQAINNPTGFDSYRWLRSRHIDGMATIIAIGTPVNSLDSASASNSASESFLKRLRTHIDQWRWQLRQHFYQNWAAQTIAEQQAKAVTLSLLTGDRSLINRDTKDLYQLAGISHLLAISGTHVLFLAIMLAGAAVLLVDRMGSALYRVIPRWQVRWWVMISAAFIYALFTGFDVPAARTAWMLLVVGLIRLTLLPISTMRVLLVLAVLMAWHDPYVLWQAGYWLSFIAVALLLKYDDMSHQQDQPVLPQQYRPSLSHDNRTSSIFLTQLWITGKRIFKLQFWLFVALLPITLLLFGKASLWGLFINLFAIGLFGWIIVPLNLLAGLCYLVLPAVADSIWSLVSMIVAGLHELIMWLTSLPSLLDAWLYTPVNMAILLMALLAMLPWLLPRGLISRWLALPPLSLLVMTVYANQQSLAITPTLYVLPTGDQYLSATVLQYPVVNDKTDKKNSNSNNSTLISANVSWLFLADHRPFDKRTMSSALTADKLTASLEQQLRTLSIKHLEGIVVQTNATALMRTFPSKNGNSSNAKNNTQLLPMTVLQLRQSIPTNQYWQAGRHERWTAYQQSYLDSNQSTKKTTISAQSCEQGKNWQLANGALTLHAMTGWSEIEDNSVWDCTIAIDSQQPIRVVRYNANDPQQSLLATTQILNPMTLQATQQSPYQNKQNEQDKSYKARIILDADTHQRIWHMWSLLCSAESFTNDKTSSYPIQWLGHSASQISADVLKRQQVDEIITHDHNPLEVALSFNTP